MQQLSPQKYNSILSQSFLVLWLLLRQVVSVSVLRVAFLITSARYEIEMNWRSNTNENVSRVMKSLLLHFSRQLRCIPFRSNTITHFEAACMFRAGNSWTNRNMQQLSPQKYNSILSQLFLYLWLLLRCRVGRFRRFITDNFCTIRNTQRLSPINAIRRNNGYETKYTCNKIVLFWATAVAYSDSFKSCHECRGYLKSITNDDTDDYDERPFAKIDNKKIIEKPEPSLTKSDWLHWQPPPPLPTALNIVCVPKTVTNVEATWTLSPTSTQTTTINDILHRSIAKILKELNKSRTFTDVHTCRPRHTRQTSCNVEIDMNWRSNTTEKIFYVLKKPVFVFFWRQSRCIPFRSDTIANVEAASMYRAWRASNSETNRNTQRLSSKKYNCDCSHKFLDSWLLLRQVVSVSTLQVSLVITSARYGTRNCYRELM